MRRRCCPAEKVAGWAGSREVAHRFGCVAQPRAQLGMARTLSLDVAAGGAIPAPPQLDGRSDPARPCS
ncbi:hypothetical protein L1887_42488 [Cichorium endivia]|nr:hypothetical protein L1887_42488 [Cichorium endivia]